MKKTVHILIAGCMAGVMGMVPGSSSRSNVGTFEAEASSTLATVTGTVRDETGHPLIGAIVALLEPSSRGRELHSVKTDLQGRFTAAVAPGAYRLRATAKGFSSMLTRINLDRSSRVSYNFALKRTETLVQKRGDSSDYRWIARSVPRHVLNFRGDQAPAASGNSNDDEVLSDSFIKRRPTFHGMAQFLAVGSSSLQNQIGQNFFGLNFAVSGSLDGNIEMALIGQRGSGSMAPQRLTAITSMRTSDRHQVTASLSYGQMITMRQIAGLPKPTLPLQEGPEELNRVPGRTMIDQISLSSMGEWQVSQPLLLIYGIDYSSFIGASARQQESILPRFAIQYTPNSRIHLNAALTPGRNRNRLSIEEFKTENIRTNLELSTPEVAFNETPVIDRSRRYETGVERVFQNGSAAIEASAFYDIISGHGVGLMALPLEASPETQAAFQQIAHRIVAMNGAARGARVMYKQSLGNRLSASIGYSAGSGSRFANLGNSEPVSPNHIFRDGFFQLATARLDLDMADRTGTRVSTVIRISPSAVVFAIDPFAGRMSVFDPNINIYVTQELPRFGLPVQWQAIVDLRNLLNQTTSVDDGAVQLLAARTSRTIRGGLAFRW